MKNSTQKLARKHAQPKPIKKKNNVKLKKLKKNLYLKQSLNSREKEL